MKFGLSERHFQFIDETVRQPIEAFGAELFCYGSRARGDHKKFSDLDLMVEAREDSKELRALVSQIQEDLVESNFPYKVDLVLLCDFAESYKPNYLNEKLRFHL